MTKRTKKTVTKTTTLEIPITAMPPETMPDGELGRQWNELYPPGTEVIVSESKTTEPSVESSRLTRTGTPATTDHKRKAGWHDCVRLDGEPAYISLRYLVFPASAFPQLAKKLRKHAADDAILEKLGMSKLRKEEPPPANEPLRQEQLLEAYRDRAAILERLNGYNPRVDRFKSEKDAIRRRMTVIDELFQKAPQDVQKYLIEVRDGLEKRLAEMAETKIRESQEHEADAKKLKAVNARINRLHTVGPDLQEHFDMNENE